MESIAARKAVQEELSRERIMRTAAEMFVKVGYRGVSMRKIALALGYSHGAIYYHFQDKAELFCAIVAHDFTGLTAILEQVEKQSPDPSLSKLQNIFVEFIRFGFMNKPQYELMFMIDDPELFKYSQSEKNVSYDKFAEAIFHVIGAPSAGKPGYAMIPWSVFLSLHGFVSYYLHTERSFEDIEPLAKAHARLLEAGLTAML